MSEPKMIGDHINDMLNKVAVKAEGEPLNEYILKVRKYLGLNQTLVGMIADITPPHLSEFEKKNRPITKAQTANLKAIFGIGKKSKPVVTPQGSFLKKCKTCKIEKAHEDFYSGQTPDGKGKYQFQECKTCSNARSAVNRAKRRAADKEVASWMRAGETTQQRKSAP